MAKDDLGNLTLADHPVIKHKVSKLRDENTTNKQFRELLSEITSFLGYQATAGLDLQTVKRKAVIDEFAGHRLKSKVALIPILRAGLGMVNPMLDILPQANVYHIGMYRSKGSDLPVLYYNKLPREVNVDVAIVLEPLIATGGTISAVLDILQKWGVKEIRVISVIASRPGLLILKEKHPNIYIHCVELDEIVTDFGKLIPGLGDVGNRQFALEVDDVQTEPSHKKQKR